MITIIERIQLECPGLAIGVRLSLFDTFPYQAGATRGVPMNWDADHPYEYGFGLSVHDPHQIDLSEPLELLRMLQAAGVDMVNLTCGSPYYNPHIQRPAMFPPSDGYRPPEDPLVGVARQIQATAEVKQQMPELVVVGSGYTYLQDFLPLVAQAVVGSQMVDFVGLGRMVLSYPRMPSDSLVGRSPTRKLVCRTFSDCTTAPRLGLVSGCYPLDAFYKQRPERKAIQDFKKE